MADFPNIADQASGGGEEDYIYIREEQTSGTEGGTATSGSFQTRTLNTEVVDTGDNATLSSNQITLLTGTYRFKASAPAFDLDRHKVRLQNVTDATTVEVGTSEFVQDTSDGYNRSLVSGRFTIASSKAFELQHRFQVTKATNGQGAACSFGVVEVYAEIEFWKES